MRPWIFYFTLLCTIIISSCDEEPQQEKEHLAQEEKVDKDNNSSASAAVQRYHYNWEDKFTRSEKDKVTKWLDSVANSVQRCIGYFPFDIHFSIFRYRGANEPAPWAHTVRGKEQGIHFYIDPRFPLEDFINDWTAQHEISHLAIPFLGKKNMWFAEGFATFLQYQVMCEMGIMSREDLQSKYESKFENKKQYFDSDMTMVEMLASLKSDGVYHALYWGGVSYFYEIDQKLKEKDLSFVEVLKKYQVCCRLRDHNLKNVIVSLDELCGAPFFYDAYQRFKTERADTVMSVY